MAESTRSSKFTIEKLSKNTFKVILSDGHEFPIYRITFFEKIKRLLSSETEWTTYINNKIEKDVRKYELGLQASPNPVPEPNQ